MTDVTARIRAGRSLRANIAWTVMGNTAYAACQWLTIVLLAWTTDPETVGRFSLALAVTAPVLMFTNLQLRGIQATDARSEFTFPTYFGLRLGATCLALAVIAVIAVYCAASPAQAFVTFLIGCAKAIESLSDVLMGLQQKHEHMAVIARSLVLKGVLSVLALGAGVLLTGELWVGCFALALAWLVTLVFYDLPAARRTLRSAGAPGASIAPRFAVSQLLRLTKLALPLGFAMTLVSLLGNIPRYFVEHALGTRALGIYSAIAYVVIAGATVMTAVGQAAAPRLARSWAAGEQRGFRVLVIALVSGGAAIGLLGGCISLVAGRFVLSLMYGPEYTAYAEVLTLTGFLSAATFATSGLGYALTAARVLRPQSVLCLCAVASCTVACAILIPRFDLLGAAWATGIASLVQLVGSTWLLRRAARGAPLPTT